MTYRITITSVVLTVSATLWLVRTSPAGEECCPAGAAAQSASDAKLPEGHPPITSGGGGGGVPGQPLPKGHPPISSGGGSGGSDVMADLQPAIGTVIVKVVQGTAGGPAVDAGDVAVQLYQGRNKLSEAKAKLDATGTAMTEGLKFAGSVQPVVAVEHGGVTYQSVGGTMTPTQPDQIVRVVVHEVTTEPVDWRIAMRHVMLQQTPHGLHVIEVLSVENPTDKTWRGAGEGQADETGHDNGGPTVVFTLPAGAADVRLGEGFHECCTKIENGAIAHAMPLLPGVTKFRFGYTITPTDGKVALDLAAAAPTQRLSVFVPEDGSTVSSDGLEASDPMQMGQHKVRMYMGQNLPAKAKVGLTISSPHLQTVPAQGAAARPAPGAPQATKVIAGAGTAALLAAAAFVLLRGPKKNGAADDRPGQTR